MTFDYELDRDDGPLLVTVTGYYSSPTRGARDSLGGRRGCGPALEPDEPEDFEIESVVDSSGRPVEDLTDAEVNLIVKHGIREVDS